MFILSRSKHYMVADGSYGSVKEDGTFSGVIGELEAGRADVGCLIFGVTNERNQAADPSVPYCQYQ